jgi:hypothetical protein
VKLKQTFKKIIKAVDNFGIWLGGEYENVMQDVFKK